MVNYAALGEGGSGYVLYTVHRPSAYVILVHVSLSNMLHCVYTTFQYISKQLSREMLALVFLHNFKTCMQDKIGKLTLS